MIGFHLFEYCRNFYNACRKILETDIETMKGGYLSLDFHGRKILINVNHIGVSTNNNLVNQEVLKSKQYQKFKEDLISKNLAK